MAKAIVVDFTTRNRTPDPLSACAGKVQFATKAAAIKQLRYGSRKMLKAYRCPHCHKFHLGNP